MTAETKSVINSHPLIKDSTLALPRLDLDEGARVLGADPKHAVRRSGGGPITVFAIRERLLTPDESLPEDRVLLSDSEIELMASLVRERGTLSPAASPAQILRAYLHLTLDRRVAS